VRFTFPLQPAAGTKTTAVVYFEIAPGDHLARHTDSAEEILYVVMGRGEAEVGGERVPIEAGSLAVVPERVPHGVHNTGDTTLKIVGFFSAAELEHVFGEPLQPLRRHGRPHALRSRGGLSPHQGRRPERGAARHPQVC
jgi:quercetin dioxygenase-like cupin family protein